MFELHVVVAGIVIFNIMELIMEIMPNYPAIQQGLAVLRQGLDDMVEAMACQRQLIGGWCGSSLKLTVLTSYEQSN
jgi:hypothetical protein